MLTPASIPQTHPTSHRAPIAQSQSTQLTPGNGNVLASARACALSLTSQVPVPRRELVNDYLTSCTKGAIVGKVCLQPGEY